MTTRNHPMPFGAELQQDGSVRFRLWAPGARGVELGLMTSASDDRRLGMQSSGNGWFELITAEARIGSRYRYHIQRDGDADDPPVPDPAARFQPGSVHGPSEVVDPTAFTWSDDAWRGRPWHETVVYELHVGTFTAEGTFCAIIERLDDLLETGITAIELMPVAAFPGSRNWGYDGVLLFAPDASYGRPDDLKALVQAAHARGLMVLLDVVYNHFGPEGNYLHLYAPQFFTERHQTPWGAGIAFDGPNSRPVRDFFIHNALYWLNEYHLDGLRLDAVHAIADDSSPDILTELAEAVHAGPGAERHVHLVLENDDNAAHFLARQSDGRPRWYAAQWNDDFHHAAHLIATGERDGYYADYADAPVRCLGRTLAEGFAYQGEPSAFRDGAERGEPSAELPPTAFVNLLQNHDQVGNRAFGERIGQLAEPKALRAMTAVLLLAPTPPLLFMGQEFMADTPFQFFCDFGADLADAVTQGRRREFARFAQFADPDQQALIPDPNDPDTFTNCKLDWQALDQGEHAEWRRFHRRLLALRHRQILPRLAGIRGGHASYQTIGRNGLRVSWQLGDGSLLTLTANLGPTELAADAIAVDGLGTPLLLQPEATETALAEQRLPPWSLAWHLLQRSEPAADTGSSR